MLAGWLTGLNEHGGGRGGEGREGAGLNGWRERFKWTWGEVEV